MKGHCYIYSLEKKIVCLFLKGKFILMNDTFDVKKYTWRDGYEYEVIKRTLVE
jgi:hypothetical protein